MQAGTLVVSHASALGTTAGNKTVVSGGATLNVNNKSTAEPLELNGPGVGDAGALTGTGTSAAVSGSVTLASDARIGVAAAGDVLTISGVIGGAGGLTKVGAGTLALTRANTYSGDTVISAGTLRVAAGNVIPDGAGKGNVVVEGTLDLNGWDEAINGLSGSGIIDNTAAGTISLGVGMNGQGGTFIGLDPRHGRRPYGQQAQHRHADAGRQQQLQRRDDHRFRRDAGHHACQRPGHKPQRHDRLRQCHVGRQRRPDRRAAEHSRRGRRQRGRLAGNRQSLRGRPGDAGQQCQFRGHGRGRPADDRGPDYGQLRSHQGRCRHADPGQRQQQLRPDHGQRRHAAGQQRLRLRHRRGPGGGLHPLRLSLRRHGVGGHGRRCSQRRQRHRRTGRSALGGHHRRPGRADPGAVRQFGLPEHRDRRHRTANVRPGGREQRRHAVGQPEPDADQAQRLHGHRRQRMGDREERQRRPGLRHVRRPG